MLNFVEMLFDINSCYIFSLPGSKDVWLEDPMNSWLRAEYRSPLGEFLNMLIIEKLKLLVAQALFC